MASPYLDVFRSPRIAAVLVLGFSSGLPLALTGSTLQAWLTVSGIDIQTIAWFSWLGLPDALKFLWSPLLDRFAPPGLDAAHPGRAHCRHCRDGGVAARRGAVGPRLRGGVGGVRVGVAGYRD